MVISLIAAGWTYRYWSRGKDYLGKTLPRVAERLPKALRDGVERRGVAGALEAPALTLWVFGPIAIPVVAGAGAVVFLALRRRRRWALAATLVAAVVAIPILYGGASALRHIEDRHYFARSPYVRTYRYLALSLAAGSFLLLGVVSADALVLARRRPPSTPG